jgi:hypothetical protein
MRLALNAIHKAEGVFRSACFQRVSEPGRHGIAGANAAAMNIKRKVIPL